MEYVSGSILIRQGVNLSKGEVVDGHEHNFDHTTYCPKGALLIEALDKEGNVLRSTIIKATDGFNWALIEAGVCHRLTALEDNTIYHCIYSHRTPQGEIVQTYTGWGPAYV